MPVDPPIQVMLDQLAQQRGPTLREAGVDQGRMMLQALAMLEGEPAALERVETVDAGGVPARVYASTTGSTLPIFVWYHGGGFVIGDLETADRTCRKLANGTGALVVSVDYRLAPEHPYPAGPDDCITALRWVVDNAAQLGGDASRVAIGGDSAGGNLSAVVAIQARDEGIALRHQLLVYPVTDCTMTSSSYVENAEGYMLTRDSMDWFIDLYLSDGADAKDPRVSPLFADDLRGVAPATVITAEYDPLRDEGEVYAERLRDAGVPTELVRFDGQIHGFFGLGTITERANEAVALAVDRVKAALA
jgi:acetyl esterase